MRNIEDATHEKCTAPFAATQIHENPIKVCETRACIFTQKGIKIHTSTGIDIEFMSQKYYNTEDEKLQVFFRKRI